MTQRQQYAIVPREPTEVQIEADEESFGLCRLGSVLSHRAALTAAIEASPPPPEQVLSDEDVRAIYRKYLYDSRSANEFDLIRLAEHAVLKKLGAKNGF